MIAMVRNHYSLDWFKGTSTGNHHGFLPSNIGGVLIYKVVPQFGIAKLVNITPINPMVYGTQITIYSIHGGYKPTNITGGHHPVWSGIIIHWQCF